MSTPVLSRKSLLQAIETPAPVLPFLILALDIAVFTGGSALALLAMNVGLKLVGTMLIAVGIVRLFLVGHEACHGSFFATQGLNNVLGRLAFLPSLTAFSLWDVGHNVAHHGFNNLKGRDQVWTPFSKPEYDGLPRHRQFMERLYRCGFGCGFYYLVELWWRKLYFATRKEIGSARVKYKLDSALVTVGAAAWVAAVAAVSRYTHQDFWLLAALAIAVPFALWNCIIGFVVFVHHTHPTIAWFQKRQEWQSCRAYLGATANVRLPFGIDRLMHNIMEHNAHHVNPRVSMFALRGAQGQLHERAAGEFLSYRLGWISYMNCVRRCKLYDYVNHTWLDWQGRVTAQVSPAFAVPVP